MKYFYHQGKILTYIVHVSSWSNHRQWWEILPIDQFLASTSMTQTQNWHDLWLLAFDKTILSLMFIQGYFLANKAKDPKMILAFYIVVKCLQSQWLCLSTCITNRMSVFKNKLKKILYQLWLYIYVNWFNKYVPLLLNTCTSFVLQKDSSTFQVMIQFHVYVHSVSCGNGHSPWHTWWGQGHQSICRRVFTIFNSYKVCST